MILRKFVATAALSVLPGLAQAAAHGDMANYTATVSGGDGAIAGTVNLSETASGEMIVTIDLAGVPAGTHAVHVHETGDCSDPEFKSAGGHAAGEAEHGVMSAAGPHPGDLPNVDAREDGVVKVTFFTPHLKADHLSDDDGAAFVMHAQADDYTSQPSGDAGARIACGVFESGK